MEQFLSAVGQEPCDSFDVTLGRSGTLLSAAFLLNAIKGCKYLDLSRSLASGMECFRTYGLSLIRSAPSANAGR